LHAPPTPCFSTPPSSSKHTPNQIELAYRLGVVAEKRCAPLIDAYNACAKGRTVSMLWACRAAYAASQDCVRQYVNQPNIDEMKRRWVRSGRPRWLGGGGGGGPQPPHPHRPRSFFFFNFRRPAL